MNKKVLFETTGLYSNTTSSAHSVICQDGKFPQSVGTEHSVFAYLAIWQKFPGQLLTLSATELVKRHLDQKQYKLLVSTGV